MCGLFGFIGGGPIDSDLLRYCAERALRRGPHSIGAWIDGKRQVGFGRDVQAHLASIVQSAIQRSAKCVVGHCRLSPDNTWVKAYNAQPFKYCFGTIAHNGNLPNFRTLALQHRLQLQTEVDSEILGSLIEKGHIKDLPRAFAQVDPGSSVALLGVQSNVLFAYRRRHPLSTEVRAEGIYFVSDPRFGKPLPSEAWHTFEYPTALAPGHWIPDNQTEASKTLRAFRARTFSMR